MPECKATIVVCRACGYEYRKPVVPVDFLNDARRERDEARAEVERLRDALDASDRCGLPTGDAYCSLLRGHTTNCQAPAATQEQP